MNVNIFLTCVGRLIRRHSMTRITLELTAKLISMGAATSKVDTTGTPQEKAARVESSNKYEEQNAI